MGGKLRGYVPLGEGDLGLHLSQCGQGRGLHARQVSPWCVKPFGQNTPTLQTRQRGQNREKTFQ